VRKPSPNGPVEVNDTVRRLQEGHFGIVCILFTAQHNHNIMKEVKGTLLIYTQRHTLLCHSWNTCCSTVEISETWHFRGVYSIVCHAQKKKNLWKCSKQIESKQYGKRLNCHACIAEFVWDVALQTAERCVSEYVRSGCV